MSLAPQEWNCVWPMKMIFIFKEEEFLVIVCVCKGVNEREIRRTIHQGCRTEESIGRNCGAGTDCGSCIEALRELLTDRQTHHQGPNTYSSLASTLLSM